MSMVYFVDIHRRQYAIAESVLADLEVRGELPADERVIAVELEPPDAPDFGRDAHIAYSWCIAESGTGQAVEYSVAPLEAPADVRTDPPVPAETK